MVVPSSSPERENWNWVWFSRLKFHDSGGFMVSFVLMPSGRPNPLQDKSYSLHHQLRMCCSETRRGVPWRLVYLFLHHVQGDWTNRDVIRVLVGFYLCVQLFARSKWKRILYTRKSRSFMSELFPEPVSQWHMQYFVLQWLLRSIDVRVWIRLKKGSMYNISVFQSSNAREWSLGTGCYTASFKAYAHESEQLLYNGSIRIAPRSSTIRN